MRTFIIVGVATLLGATAVSASGPVIQPPAEPVYVPPSPVPWQGAYVGASLGVGAAHYGLSGRYTDPTPPGTDIGLSLPDLAGRGGMFAVQGGYNYQLSDRWVAGVQLDATVSGITLDTSFNVTVGADTLSGSYDLTPRTMYTVGGRLGYLTSPDTMVYGLLGLTRANFRADYGASLNGAPLAAGSYDFSLNGAALGIGVETRLTDRTTLGLEYRYNRMQRYSFYDGPLLGGDNLEIGFNTSIHTIRAMLNVHF